MTKSKAPCPGCFHGLDWHKEDGCKHPYCTCKATYEEAVALVQGEKSVKPSNCGQYLG